MWGNKEAHKRSRSGKLGDLTRNGKIAHPGDALRPANAKVAYYAAVIQYMGNYIWKIEDHFPQIDSKLWKTTGGHAAEYFQAVNIRDSAAEIGKELTRIPPDGEPERSNYAAQDYMQRLDAIEDANGETKGVLIDPGRSQSRKQRLPDTSKKYKS